MNNLKKILFLPLGLFSILLILGGIYLSFMVMWGLAIGAWMGICGVLGLVLVYPLSKTKYSLWGQVLVMSICPIVMIGYFLVNEYFYEQEFICLIPAGYTGKVIIKYDEKTGKAPRFESGKILLEIDTDGTLETQHEQKGVIDLLSSEYHYVTPDKNRISIPEGIADSSTLQIWDVQFYATDSASFQTFYVGTPNDFLE